MNEPDSDSFPTVIEGIVRQGRLEIIVHNLVTGRVQSQFSFQAKRRG